MLHSILGRPGAGWPALALFLLAARTSFAEIPSPEAYFGHPMGADRTLVSVDELLPYYELVAERSDRVELVRLGKTTEGRDLVMLVVSTPGNLARQDRYREIAARLHDPRGLSEREIDALVEEGRVILFVAMNIHSSEIAVSQAAPEWIYELASGGPDSAARYLEDVILLIVPSMNPDGQAMVAEWYGKFVGTPYEGCDLPRLYHRYAGHDNNRDWFMLNLEETRLVNRAIYHRWFPQVLVDEHQMGVTGPRIFVPPYADPVSDKVHPLIHRGALLIGAGMAMDLEQEGKGGVIYGYSFDAYWPGGTRSTPWWKNTVGILTEIASARFMTPVYVDPGELTGGRKGLPRYQAQINFPNPWPGGWWRPRDIVEYSLILSRSALETCALHRDDFLRNRAIMARDAVERGAAEAPYAYVVPPAQHDSGSAARLVDLLLENGVEVRRSTRNLLAGDRSVPAGSFVIPASQPLRSFVLEMMDTQTYPEVQVGVHSPEIHPPYDVTAWSLPLLMGVDAFRLDSPLEGPLEPVADGGLPGRWFRTGATAPAWLLDPRENEAYTAVIRLVSRGRRVEQAMVPLASGENPVVMVHRPGTFLVHADARDLEAVIGGLRVTAVPVEMPPVARETSSRQAPGNPPPSPYRTLRLPRIAVYQSWLAPMDEGWLRYVLDGFELPYGVIHNQDLQAGNLRRSFDAILLPDLNRREILEGIEGSEGNSSDPPMPPAYVGGVGTKGKAALEEFVREGGTLIALGNAVEFVVSDFRVPVRLLSEKPSRREYSTPGTLLRVQVDTRHPLGFGMPEEAVVYHTTDPVLGTQIPGPTTSRDVVARFADSESLVASGWARGIEVLERKPALLECSLGRGKVVLFAFRPQYRGQTQGTYRMLVNALLDAAAR